MKQSIFLLSLSFFLFLQSCGDKQEQPAQEVGEYPVIEIPLKTITSYSSYPTRIEGTTNSEVRAKVSGYITEVLVDEGEAVKKGKPLFKLETQSLSQDAEAAQANVNAAQVEVDKLHPLVEKNIISNVQLETAKARLAQAKSAYNSIAANIGYATIKSPVEGYVGSIPFRNGALVSPGDATPLTTVAAIENVYAYFSMNEREYLNFIETASGTNLAEKIKNLPKVELILANGSTYEEQGTVETVTGQIDRNTGTVSFRALFPNPNRLLANGSSGTIRVPKEYKNVPVVPESATYEQQGVVYVYKIQDDTLAISTPVELVERVKNIAIIRSGIKEGDVIVGQGVSKLRNNTTIESKPVAFDSIVESFNTVFQ
tara:strand:- start:77483 stop:78595 length:1113 start_codon:yes stop_codon:yes gene_type:complete